MSHHPTNFAARSAGAACWASLGLAAIACGGDSSGPSPDGSTEDATPTDASVLRSDAASDGAVGDAGGSPDASLGGGGDGAAPSDGALAADRRADAQNGPGNACSGATHSTNAPQTSLPSAPALTVASGFGIEVVASVAAARELAALPNGDLLVAANSPNIYLLPNAEAISAPGTPVIFATMPESPAQGITFEPSSCTIYVATTTGIFSMAYVDGLQSATPGKAIAHVRGGSVAGTDGDVHITTSVTFSGGSLYAGVGSSCNACVETDPTRASVQVMAPNGANMTTRATRIRNAIALATNPATGSVWAGGAGQDALPGIHPYEFFDAVTLHPGIADYGWPDCEENNHAYAPAANCASTVAPLIELPAYSTLIGAAFYPLFPTGAHAFSTAYRGGVFIAAHGGWHMSGGKYLTPPRVVYVPMSGDSPTIPVDWSDPTKQWSDFVSGFQLADGVTRIGRPTGVAVGSAGSLFVADDANGYVYRIRPL